MLKFMFSLVGASWRVRILGYLTAAVAAFGGVLNDIDDNPNNQTDWEVNGALILAGLGIAQSRQNNISSEKAGVK